MPWHLVFVPTLVVCGFRQLSSYLPFQCHNATIFASLLLVFPNHSVWILYSFSHMASNALNTQYGSQLLPKCQSDTWGKASKSVARSLGRRSMGGAILLGFVLGVCGAWTVAQFNSNNLRVHLFPINALNTRGMKGSSTPMFRARLHLRGARRAKGEWKGLPVACLRV